MTDREPGSRVDLLAELRRPFTAEAVRFKIQAGGSRDGQRVRALVVCYIDARTVVARLNHVCGLDWSDEYRWVQAPKPALECTLTVAGTSRRDVGLAGSGQEGDTPKAIYSDALKRAAVRFGVGESLYATPKMFVDPSGIRYGQNGKPQGLAEAGEAHCREVYATWLRVHGVAAFGAPLDHGDVLDATGDYETAAAEAGHDEGQNAAQHRGNGGAARPGHDTRPATQDQVRRLFALGGEVLGRDEEALHLLVAWVTREMPCGPVMSFKALDRGHIDRVFRTLQRMHDDAEAGERVRVALEAWSATYDDLLADHAERQAAGDAAPSGEAGA